MLLLAGVITCAMKKRGARAKIIFLSNERPNFRVTSSSKSKIFDFSIEAHKSMQPLGDAMEFESFDDERGHGGRGKNHESDDFKQVNLAI